MFGFGPLRGSLFLDTNIFVFFLVASLDPNLLKNCRRTEQFSVEDFDLLLRFIEQFREMRVTPPVITESCNLLEDFNNAHERSIFAALTELLKKLGERHVRSVELADTSVFLSLGLADASLFSAASKGASVLTEDFKLRGVITGRGFMAENFNHLRSHAWGIAR